MKKSNARIILEKANFFLTQAEHSDINNRNEIGTFLEAAIVFARSVTFHLQKQFKKYDQFEDWYAKKVTEMSNDPEFSFFKNKRNFILKEGALSIKKNVFVSMSEVVLVGDIATVRVVRSKPWYRRRVKILISDLISFIKRYKAEIQKKYNSWRFQNKRQEMVESTTEIKFVFEDDELGDIDAFEMFRNYLDKLDQIITEAEDLFITGK